MNLSFRWGVPVVWLAPLLFNGPAICEEPKPGDVKAKPEAADPKPAGAASKPANDEAKEKPAARGKEAEVKNEPKAVKARNQAGIEALASPLRILFGGPAEQAALVNPAAPQQAPNEAGDNDPLTLQYLQQLRPLLNAELGFIRTVCGDLTVEQRSKIKTGAENALKAAAKQMANEQMKQRQGIAQVNGAAPANADPVKTLRQAILKSLEESLTIEQLNRFVPESSKRIDDRRKASILSMISGMDAQLYLSDEQRQKIEQAIQSRWQDEWESWAFVGISYGNRYLPMVPDDCVSPHLNEDQKTVWRGIGKVNVRNWGVRNRQAMQLDDWWGQDPGNPVGGVARPVMRVGF